MGSFCQGAALVHLVSMHVPAFLIDEVGSVDEAVYGELLRGLNEIVEARIASGHDGEMGEAEELGGR